MPIAVLAAWAVASPLAALIDSTSRGAAAVPMTAAALKSPCWPIVAVKPALRASRPVALSAARASLSPSTVLALLRPARLAVACTSPTPPMLMSLAVLLAVRPRAVTVRSARALSIWALLPVVAASATAEMVASAITVPADPAEMAVSLRPSATRPALAVASLAVLRATALSTPVAMAVMAFWAPAIRPRRPALPLMPLTWARLRLSLLLRVRSASRLPAKALATAGRVRLTPETLAVTGATA